MKKKVGIVLLALAVSLMMLPATSALAGKESQAGDLLISSAESNPDGVFSATGFAGKGAIENGMNLAVTLDFIGIITCSDHVIIVRPYRYYHDAVLTPRANSQGKVTGYLWSVEDTIFTIPGICEEGTTYDLSWSVTHIRAELTSKDGVVVKESDLPLPYSPF